MTSNKILELERDLAIGTLRWVRMVALDPEMAPVKACAAIAEGCKYALDELDKPPVKQETDS